MKPARVLIVDDNTAYREAFRRNLMLQGYDVTEAGDAEEALARLGEQEVDVVVTDLAMHHPTEGLDLIRHARSLRPHLPIIMISAVGTFDEAAEASRLGARYVISKSKIEEEMGNLFAAIDRSHEEYQRSLEHARELEKLRSSIETRPAEAAARLRQIVADSTTPDTIRVEAFDMLHESDAQELLQGSRQDLSRSQVAEGDRDVFARVDANLKQIIPALAELTPETQEALRTAEFLYLHDAQMNKGIDLSRSIGFSYCFAVENEAKTRLRKRLQKFLSEKETPDLVRSLLEKNGRNVSLFFHQHLLRAQREISMEITIDNVYQTFQRILEHGCKYKPDGLKALGIILLCFGRTYSFRKFNEEVRIDNPLGLKAFESEGELLHMASLLTNLQHFRNPYIHPEISVMEKLSKIRDTSFECMRMVAKIY
jgi:CheY-like chemotaxis protein